MLFAATRGEHGEARGNHSFILLPPFPCLPFASSELRLAARAVETGKSALDAAARENHVTPMFLKTLLLLASLVFFTASPARVSAQTKAAPGDAIIEDALQIEVGVLSQREIGRAHV